MRSESIQQLALQYQAIHEAWSQEVASAQASLNGRILDIESVSASVLNRTTLKSRDVNKAASEIDTHRVAVRSSVDRCQKGVIALLNHAILLEKQVAAMAPHKSLAIDNEQDIIELGKALGVVQRQQQQRQQHQQQQQQLQQP
jgi:hypothetical protein